MNEQKPSLAPDASSYEQMLYRLMMIEKDVRKAVCVTASAVFESTGILCVRIDAQP